MKRRRLVCTFGGGGGGAAGFQQARAELYGQTSEFELVGGFDKDEYACKAFEYMTGVPQVCIDAREVTPGMMREFYGEEAPFALFGSPPCQGASKLLSTAKSRTAKYELLNELALVNTRLILDAWPDSPPAFVLYENVPNITSRAPGVLREVRRLLKSAGYVLQDGYHEARHVGNLAQRRKRWFLVARNPRKVPAFLYLPPHQPGKVCGDVLNELPMPGDTTGGPMHELPAISALNWWRLWAIPAGGDWRDLLPQDGTPRRARFRRHHVERWTEPSVTIGGTGSNGPCGVADPRAEEPARFKGSLGVLRSDEPAGAVTAEAYPSTGRFAIADECSLLGMRINPTAPANHYVVADQGGIAPTVTTATRPGNGAPSYAAPVPLQLEPQAGNAQRHYDKYAVRPWRAEALTVHGATRVGSGAQSIAQPLEAKGYRGAWGVLAADGEAGTVTGNARPATGPFSYAAPAPLELVPEQKCFDKGYAVIDREREPSHAIAATSSVGCGTYSITDRVPEPLDLALRCQPHAGAYGVIGDVAPTVIAAAKIDNSAAAIADPKPVAPPFVVLSYEQAKLVADGRLRAPFAVVDPARPEEPLAIVDDMQRPPYRWIEAEEKNGKRARRKEVVPLVLISEDGTWHRPLTTLELAVLQGMPWRHNEAPLDFGEGATKQRRLIGNAVPVPVGTAIADQMLRAGLAADQGCFFLFGGGSGLWVRPEHRAPLLRAGVRRVRQEDADKLAPGEVAILDDRAPRIRGRKRRGRAVDRTAARPAAEALRAAGL